MAGNWAREGKQWFPIETVPPGAVVVLANADLTKQWIVDKAARPTKTRPAKAPDREHVRDDAGQPTFDDKGKPVMVDTEVAAAWWAPARYV